MAKKRSAAIVQSELRELIETEGLEAAYKTSLAVCRDEKAPANARTQAASNLMRAAGLFALRPDGLKVKEAYEMTGEELQEGIDRLEAMAEARLRGDTVNGEDHEDEEDRGDNTDIFE